MTGSKSGNREAERRASYYTEKWVNDGVTRYFYQKVQHCSTHARSCDRK